MTAEPNTTTKVPLSPLAIIMFTLAAVGTALVVPHVVFAVIGDWPPQFMTLHAVTVVGFWLAGFHYRAHPPGAPAEQPEPEPPRHTNNQHATLAAGFAALDEQEIEALEQRLRETDM